ncbi:MULTISPECIES: protein-export chaperone SecB [Gluconobacter]|uniref:Protein-export protein SecB n=1 Tax=Gluconobacter albidus TaxID=318683 RepID=A0ABQ5X1N8_9PROT|nr:MULTISPECIES: protein-export chaperone SecB [Gluconobacter]AQS90599.1 preprotein translocase subunit SecB [Gluconobacter albidus]MBS1028782.1 protein-export chaperone SecB [Gluconobacter albidus]OUI83479.1 preprotein translocase subunit SecB [Gluconobacter sp. DsW_056]GBQ86772.1 protein translocase subunit SecB [Gluconobacter albidus NBRC 3250]GLQ69197.1 protein-export protein SecB [Gluconobacter albidus]
MDQTYTDTVTGSPASLDVSDSLPSSSSLIVGSQYLRTLTIDVQNTPDVYRDLPSQPHIGMTVDVTGRQLGDQPTFEVSLVIRAQGFENAPTQDAPTSRVLYEISLAYAGLFGLTGRIPQDAIEPLLLVEAPRFLFPPARSVLLNTIREAGFPSPNIQPIDFHSLWQSRRAQQR